MKGVEDGVYILAILFTFIIGTSAMYLFAINSRGSPQIENAHLIEEYFGIPPQLTEKLSEGGSLKAAVEFSGFLDGGKGMIVRNLGDVPLSGFAVLIDSEEILPLISPDILFPESYGVIILDDVSWEKISSPSFIEIRTKQGATVVVKK